MDEYKLYATGQNLTQRMPLFVYPPQGVKISVKQVRVRGSVGGVAAGKGMLE